MQIRMFFKNRLSAVYLNWTEMYPEKI